MRDGLFALSMIVMVVAAAWCSPSAAAQGFPRIESLPPPSELPPADEMLLPDFVPLCVLPKQDDEEERPSPRAGTGTAGTASEST